MHGFGTGGTGGMPGSADFNEVARQYWSAWSDMLRGTTPAPAATMPGWGDVAGWWSQLAGPAGSVNPGNLDELLRRLNSHAGGWYGQMQQLASRFAGQNPSAAEVAAAWKQMLGGDMANPLAGVFSALAAPGQQWLDAWSKVMPFRGGAAGGTDGGRGWFDLPTFGFAREHQERWQRLAKAQLDYQEKNNAYQALMAEAAQQAFSRFEDRLAERSEPGRQVTSARALFDLWVDAAEEAYAEIALSPRFGRVYGELVDAQMRLRAAMQGEVDQICAQLGMPTRTEVDAAHRKITKLERELRRMREAMDVPRPTSRTTDARSATAAESPAEAAATEPDTDAATAPSARARRTSPKAAARGNAPAPKKGKRA